MKQTPPLPTWAPRLKPYLIRRLYEKDALGIVDEELLNEVGWGLYARCESFIQAIQATQGSVICPFCSSTINHQLKSREILRCPSCGWVCAWRDYLKTIRNQQLSGGPEVVALFQEFVEQFPKAQKTNLKMLLIDQLIHGFHHYLGSGRTRRPVGVNLLDGDVSFVSEFLDQLTYGPGSSPGLKQNHVEWQEKIRHQPPKSSR